MGNPTRDLPAWNIVPQPSTLTRALPERYELNIYTLFRRNTLFKGVTIQTAMLIFVFNGQGESKWNQQLMTNSFILFRIKNLSN
jgi:hypothetical protein